MADNVAEPQAALKYETEVREHGRVELHVPLATGARIIVFIIRNNEDSFSDLVAATTSSLGFWNNPLDDEDWKEA